jgi:hypothetical protein
VLAPRVDIPTLCNLSLDSGQVKNNLFLCAMLFLYVTGVSSVSGIISDCQY